MISAFNRIARILPALGLAFALVTLPEEAEAAVRKKPGVTHHKKLPPRPASAPKKALRKAPAAKPVYAHIVMDYDTGAVLAESNADALRHPASVTKVMTLLMLFDEIKAGRLQPDDDIVFSKQAAAMPATHIGTKAGGTISVADAISALIVHSANDVAVAVAEKISKSEPAFAAKMTAKAQSLGMKNTTFVNASGLPDSRQVTTARDMAILARVLIRDYADYYENFSKQTFDYGGKTYKTHNYLMSRYEGMDGIKTGFIRASMFNLLASVQRDGRRLVGAVFGGSTAAARDAKMAALFDEAFEKGPRQTVALRISVPAPANR